MHTGEPSCAHSRDTVGESGITAASASEHCSPERRRAARLVIANTHLLFNPKRGDIKAAQLMVLTGKVERYARVC